MIVSKKVQIIQKPGVTYFQRVNSKWIDFENLKLGKYLTAVNAMIAKSEMNQLLLREIIAINPDNPNGNWENLLKEWWSNINVSVPKLGLTLEVGLIYDVTDVRRQKRINEVKLACKVNQLTDEDLANYVQSRIDYSDRCLYAAPIKTLDYLYYCFALIHREVANTITEMDKSMNIRFYLHTEEEERKTKEQEAKLRTEVAAILAEVAKDNKKVIKMLRVYNTLDDITPYKITQDDSENLQNLVVLFTENPSLFKVIAQDTNLTMKSFIQELFEKGLIERLLGSNVIVLTSDKNIIIGNTIDDAIKFFIDDKNKELKDNLVKQKNILT